MYLVEKIMIKKLLSYFMQKSEPTKYSETELDIKLCKALFESDIVAAKKLIEKGASIDGLRENSARPIVAASSSDNPKMLKFVIDKGANVNIDDGYPLYETIDGCIDGMIQNNRDAPYPESLEMLKLLLDYGADPEIKDKNGRRPIDVIKSYSGDKESLELLKSHFRPLIPDIDKLLM